MTEPFAWQVTKPIFLCGFMGVGKSTVGQILSKKLAWPFFDVDQMVIRAAGRSIPEIFAQSGEAKFRELERSAIFEVALKGVSVVALGGGALGNPESLKCIRMNGWLIFLKANVASLTNRLQTSFQARPLLADLNESQRAKKIASLLLERQTIYELADYKIQTDDRDPLTIAEDIMRELTRSKS